MMVKKTDIKKLLFDQLTIKNRYSQNKKDFSHLLVLVQFKDIDGNIYDWCPKYDQIENINKFLKEVYGENLSKGC
jgi:hypothetical protein